MKILIINAGSSSYKLALFEVKKSPTSPQEPIWSGILDYQSSNQTSLHASLDNGTFIEKIVPATKATNAIQELLETTLSGTTKCLNALSDIDVIGHRVVHGGDAFRQPLVITPRVKEAVYSLIPLAPLHNSHNLEGIELMAKLLPSALQIAVFDTAFHTTLPPSASTYPGPYSWREMGIKRYGFHGINHSYCTARCATLLNQEASSLNILSCHLGNGCSIAAVHNGRCIDTTMGFTPLDGLMMGTRPGTLDPGILLYLQQDKRMSAKELFQSLNYDSGLKGISGVTSDMRQILQLSSQGNARAKLAYDMYVHSLKRNLGAMAAVLGNVDALVFTGGVGENVPSIRHEACNALQQMGLELDLKKNKLAKADEVISTETSLIYTLVIHAREEWSIAGSCWEIANRNNTTVEPAKKEEKGLFWT